MSRNHKILGLIFLSIWLQFTLCRKVNKIVETVAHQDRSAILSR